MEVEDTIYSSIPMQLFMIHSIKKPILDGVRTIFNPKASKIDKLRASRKLWKAIQLISKMPEPTVENTWHPNTHNLIRLRDWFFTRCSLDSQRTGLIKRLMDFVIILYDFDPPWRWIFDSLREEALQMEWKPKGFQDTWVDSYVWWRE